MAPIGLSRQQIEFLVTVGDAGQHAIDCAAALAIGAARRSSCVLAQRSTSDPAVGSPDV